MILSVFEGEKYSLVQRCLKHPLESVLTGRVGAGCRWLSNAATGNWKLHLDLWVPPLHLRSVVAKEMPSGFDRRDTHVV